MKAKETAREFHYRLSKDGSEPGEITIYRSEDYSHSTRLPYNRRDFYKISLVVKGSGILSFEDKAFHIGDNMIIFFNPMIPYSWQPTSDVQIGFSCLFTGHFVDLGLKSDSLANSPLFRVDGQHIFFLEQPSMELLTRIFEQMLAELKSSYIGKYELIRNYIQILIHEALKIYPAESSLTGNYPARITTLFSHLLEKQFPIVSPDNKIRYKSPNEFADQLSIHTNHLNRALKETTGKTTSELIAERIIKEAKALLQHSNWDVSEIGYCLGFEHPSNFNSFFKKHTGLSPYRYRRQPVVIL